MSIRYECDACYKLNDDDLDIYEMSQEAKDYTGLDYDHICKQCFEDLNQDKDLKIKNGKVILNNKKKK